MHFFTRLIYFIQKNKNNIDMLDSDLIYERLYNFQMNRRLIHIATRWRKPEFSQYYINQILVSIPLSIELLAIDVDYY